MSENESADHGHKITEQDILKIFDTAGEPFLTSSEIAEQLPVSRQAVNYRLDRMREKELVDKKKTGARSVGWWATVAPRLDPDAAERADTADRDSAVSLDELDAEFDAA